MEIFNRFWGDPPERGIEGDKGIEGVRLITSTEGIQGPQGPCQDPTWKFTPPQGFTGVKGPGPHPTGVQGSQFGYHKTKIERGVFGETSKIREEVEELLDAERQGVRLMQLQELSDIVGAVQGYLVKNHAGTTLQDLIKMAEVTNRAFEVGERNARV